MIRTTLSQTQRFILQKNYLMARQASDLNQLLGDLVGLPHQATPLAAQIRLASPLTYNESDFLIALVMRNTPHLIRVSDYPSLFVATSRQRKQDFNAQFRLWGVENEAIDQLGEQILARLHTSPLTLSDINAQFPTQTLSQTSRGGHTSHTTDVQLALAWFSAQGKITLCQDQHYRPMPHVYPQLNLNQTPSEAEAQYGLVRGYLAAYGPANEADISLWTGLSKSETARAMGMLTSETTLVLVEGLPGMLLMLKEQTEALMQTPPWSDPLITFLPSDDPFVTAHRASRARYFIDPKHYRQVFNAAGIPKPTLLLNGQIIGTWDTPLTWQLLTDLDPLFQPYLTESAHRLNTYL